MRKLIAISTLALLALGLGCTTRNLYKNYKFPAAPVERGFTYMSRDLPPDAGVEPVEYGGVLVTKDVVYLASETKGLEAFEHESFIRKWQFNVKNGVSSELLKEDNVIYFGANDGAFYAVDADFGKVLWRYETKAPVFAQATVANKRIYLSASDDVVYCLDQMTGKWIWHYKRGGSYITTVRGNSRVAVPADVMERGGKDLAYVGFSDGYLVALNAQDGNLQWETKVHSGSKFTDVDAMPVIDGSRLYVSSYDGSLYALDRANGKVLWRVDIGSSKRVIVEDKVLYLSSSDGNIYSLNKDSGRILWKFELDRGTATTVLLFGNYIAFGSSQQYFYLLHKGDGSLAYRFDAGLRSGFSANPMSSPADSNDSVGAIYAMSNFGNLYVFKATRPPRPLKLGG